MFVDRHAEMAALLKSLASQRPSLVRLYGRRRVGKTELLRALGRKVKALVLLADEADRPQQLEAFSRQIAEFTGGLRPPLRDWDDLLDAVEGVVA